MWTPLLVVLQLASQTPAAPTPTCYIRAISAYPHAKYLDSGGKTLLEGIRKNACEGVSFKGVERERIDALLEAFTYRLGACRGPQVNPDYQAALQKQPLGASLRIIFGKFCQDTFDPAPPAYMKVNAVPDRVVWLRGELFCAWTEYVADPGGWMALFKSELPSLVQLRSEGKSLCEGVRDRKMSSDDGWYRFDLAMARVREHLPAESARSVANTFKSVLDAAKNLFAD